MTAYFNIGSFPKGSISNIFTPDLYKKWIKIFAKITNPMVGYFDDPTVAELFRKIRDSGGLGEKTKIEVVERKALWSFNLLNQTAKIFADPFYPKFLPNTKIPEYPCAMHAKYELVSKTVTLNPLHTEFFAWIDIGLFRSLKPEVIKPFQISLPPEFNVSRIAYSEVVPRDPGLSSARIFKSNAVWVCGCFFIGRHDVMTTWTRLYMDYVEAVLRHGLMNTDQQVLYAMVNNLAFRKDVEVQTYGPEWRGRSLNPWFRLGYLCMKRDNAYVYKVTRSRRVMP